MFQRFADSQAVMRRALELAARGRGLVEPNPLVGAVLVDDELNLVAEGYHQQFGGPHAELHALQSAGPRAAGKILYVTLEPCCHQGKTGPCTQAIIDAGVRQVVAAMHDPSPHAAGRGFSMLRDAGIPVEVGMMETEAAKLAAPFLMLVTSGRPWIHAKWAMTLDGKIASRTGSSRWISGEGAREIVHRLRGRMDAIMVGSETARHDDPLLTARPAGLRIATRIVIDTQAGLSFESQLVRTADQAPVLIVVGNEAPETNIKGLRSRGVDVLVLPFAQTHAGGAPQLDLLSLLQELGRRRLTNILVEGGGRLLGSLFDLRLIDEAHVFVSPRFIGGERAPTAIGGIGLENMSAAAQLDSPTIEVVGEDVYFHGPLHFHGPMQNAKSEHGSRQSH